MKLSIANLALTLLVYIVLPLSILLLGIGIALDFFGFDAILLLATGGCGFLGSLMLALIIGAGSTERPQYVFEYADAGVILIESDTLVIGDALEISECERVSHCTPGEYRVCLTVRKAGDVSEIVAVSIGNDSDTDDAVAEVDVETSCFMVIDGGFFDKMEATGGVRKFLRKSAPDVGCFTALEDETGHARGMAIRAARQGEYTVRARFGTCQQFGMYCAFLANEMECAADAGDKLA